jgi:hypothetical protein
MMDLIERLVEIDSLEQISIKDKTCFKHTSHRFTLPILLAAQRKGILPHPCKLICFDRHHDCRVPIELEKVKQIDAHSVDLSTFVDFCLHDLITLNDEWIIAGIELGMIDDVVMFGVRDTSCPAISYNNIYESSQGKNHNVIIKSAHPGQMLDHQGEMADLCLAREQRTFWDILGWSRGSGGVFGVSDDQPPFLLDIDLDCFAFRWEDFVFPWPDEVYQARYLDESEYHTTRGLSGKIIFNELLKHAGMITIATEPGCCGSNEKSNKILQDLERLILDPFE